MYEELDTLEQIKLAIQFKMQDAPIPKQLLELLDPIIIKKINNPN